MAFLELSPAPARALIVPANLARHVGRRTSLRVGFNGIFLELSHPKRFASQRAGLKATGTRRCTRTDRVP